MATIVNGDTSLILVNTRDLTANQSAVVLLSSIQQPGRTVTVRDSVGFLSTSQSIVISTMSNVTFADGTSSVRITQPFGFLTVTSRDSSSWNLTNTYGFPTYQTLANVNALTTSSITTRDLFVQSTISTTNTVAQLVTATSTAVVQGPAFVSTLIVGPSNYTPLSSDPGYSAYVQGNVRLLSNLDVNGAGQFRGAISTGSNVIIAGSVSTFGGFGARGDILSLGNIYALNGTVQTNNLELRGGATIFGPVTFSNTLAVASNVAVQTSVSSFQYTTSTLQLASQLAFQEKTITYRTADLLFSHPITAPAISTTNFTASNAITAGNLTVTGSITAESTATLTLSSAAITNPNGSLVISSILANTATFSNQISTQQLQASSLTVSSILLTGNLTASGTSGFLTINSVLTSTLSTGAITAGTLIANQFQSPDLTVSYLTLTSSLTANSLSSCSLSNVAIQNLNGSLTTGSIGAQFLTAASSMTIQSGLLTTPASVLRIQASNVAAAAASISTLTASTLTTSTITATRLTIGAPPTTGTNGPTFQAEQTYPSTNVVISGGPGDYITPFTVSNVKPAGIGPGMPYTVDASFALNFNGPTLPGYYAYILGLNLFPNGEPNSVISVRTYNDSNTIVSLYGLYGTTQSYATPSGTGGIPVPSGTLPSSFLHVTGTLYGNTTFNLQFQSRFNDNFTSIDSNNVITVQNGVLRWPYFLNGTTIENSLNDMSVRNLYYYGSLNFASDPVLKEQIVPANLQRCTEILQALPLKRYRYTDAYLSTFQPRDVHRLGILATDLEQAFPKSITYTTLSPAFSTIRLVDTQQLEMAHLGATQALVSRVESLQSTFAGLQREVENLRNR